MKTSIKLQAGRSMVEMLGVLAIIGVLSVGGIVGYNMAIEKHRLNEAVAAVNLIIQETRNMFAKEDNYYGLGTAYSPNVASGEDIDDNYPATRILERLKINTYYPIVLGDLSTPPYGFYVSVYVLNSLSNCVKLASMNWHEYGGDFSGVGAAGFADIKKKMSVSEAQEYCKGIVEAGDDGLYRFAIYFGE